MFQSAAPRRGSRRTRVVYSIEAPSKRDAWILSEEKVPESRPHDLVVDRVRGLLEAWAQRASRGAAVCRNLAVRWREEAPAIGVDPDVCVLAPPPPDSEQLTSLCLWKPGHCPPVLAVEVVSESRAGKDYTQSPDKYAANGTRELWVFDPKLAGPTSHGGPYRIQLWRRDDEGDFQRTYAGEGPVWSEAVQGFVHAVNGGSELSLSDDEQGARRWMTLEEAERAAKEEAERRAERLAAKLRELGVDPASIP